MNYDCDEADPQSVDTVGFRTLIPDSKGPQIDID